MRLAQLPRTADLRETLGLWRRRLLDLLLPVACAGCGREGALFCESCRAATPLLSTPRCPYCEAPLRYVGERCALCARHPFVHLSGLRTDYLYDGSLRRALLAYKYRSLYALAEPMSELLIDTWQRRSFLVDLIVPIPLHPKRQRSRGFNQATLLAEGLARATGLPLQEKALTRLRDTPPVARAANQEERRALVAGAFTAGAELTGKAVLLVDDVCTTGATLEAAALICREAGTSQVWGLVLARAL